MKPCTRRVVVGAAILGIVLVTFLTVVIVLVARWGTVPDLVEARHQFAPDTDRTDAGRDLDAHGKSQVELMLRDRPRMATLPDGRRLHDTDAVVNAGCVRAIARDPSEDITVMEVPQGWEASAMRYKASPVAGALWGIGEPAWPVLKRCLDEEQLDARTRRVLKTIVRR